MTLRQLSVYIGHIPAIMAKEALIESVVASLPHMDEESRAAVIASWNVQATGRVPETVSEAWQGDRVSFEEFVRGDMKERIM